MAQRILGTYVRDSTISRNSWLVGTTGMSFHWVFILAATAKGCCRCRRGKRSAKFEEFLSIIKIWPHWLGGPSVRAR